MISASPSGDRPLPAPALPGAPVTDLRLSVLFAFLIALAAVEWVRTASAPAGAAGFGILALAVCLLLPVADARTAAMLPALVAVAVVRLASVALLPAGSPVYRFALAALPTLVAAVAAARAATQLAAMSR